MGGFGSGRWRDRAAGRCEHYHRIDLAYLAKRGLLQLYYSGSLTWSRGGHKTGDIRFTSLPHGLRLQYRARTGGGEEWSTIDEVVAFTETRTAFDGNRRWFVCQSCRRRCRVLYGGARFRCRRCHCLTYHSQYERAAFRGLSRAQNVRRALGGSGSIDDPFPAKPKGMHWRTYRRLEARDAAAEESWAVGMWAWINRLGRR